MSVQELFDFQKGELLDWVRNPRAWVLRANPVWGRTETRNRIAIFDTHEMAKAYFEASKLPELGPGESHEKYKTNDGYYRSFRPDSLLWDYNPDEYGGPLFEPAFPWFAYEGVTMNPTPPSGPILNGPKEWSPSGLPNLKDFSTNKPQYGRDYDQGFGGPHSNMDHVLPDPPPAARP